MPSSSLSVDGLFLDGRLIGGRLVVNEILGTCSVAIGPRYEGVHLVSGNTLVTEISTGVSWSVTEAR